MKDAFESNEKGGEALVLPSWTKWIFLDKLYDALQELGKFFAFLPHHRHAFLLALYCAFESILNKDGTGFSSAYKKNIRENPYAMISRIAVCAGDLVKAIPFSEALDSAKEYAAEKWGFSGQSEMKEGRRDNKDFVVFSAPGPAFLEQPGNPDPETEGFVFNTFHEKLNGERFLGDVFIPVPVAPSSSQYSYAFANRCLVCDSKDEIYELDLDDKESYSVVYHDDQAELDSKCKIMFKFSAPAEFLIKDKRCLKLLEAEHIPVFGITRFMVTHAMSKTQRRTKKETEELGQTVQSMIENGQLDFSELGELEKIFFISEIYPETTCAPLRLVKITRLRELKNDEKD